MIKTTKITTQVFELPADEAARSQFLKGIKALTDECNATWISGSVHNEIAYIETLEKELADHVGELGVEDIRREFEHSN